MGSLKINFYNKKMEISYKYERRHIEIHNKMPDSILVYYWNPHKQLNYK